MMPELGRNRPVAVGRQLDRRMAQVPSRVCR
jgi:hypothetical protein